MIRAEDLEDDTLVSQIENIVDDRTVIEEEKPVKKTTWQRTCIRISASVISFAASYMSVYYTFSWFQRRLPWIQAMLMTVIIVGTILLVPQMIKSVAERLSFRRSVAVFLLSAILLISATFSMMTTIGTLYNAQSSEAISSSTSSDERSVIESGIEARRAKRERVEQAIEMAVRDESMYSGRINALLEEGTSTGTAMASLVSNRNKAQTAREKAEKEISDLIEQEETSGMQASQIVVARPDFITWVSDRVGANRDQTEFWMNAIPAIFVDVLAPSMLMVALFL
jgi:hypothetical protein